MPIVSISIVPVGTNETSFSSQVANAVKRLEDRESITGLRQHVLLCKENWMNYFWGPWTCIEQYSKTGLTG